MTTYSTVALSTLFKHRYKFYASIYKIRTKEFVDTTVFLDTGCFNTMIPRRLAEQTGRSLGFKMRYSLGGSIFQAEAFSIEKIMIGDFLLERVIAFAGDYKGSHEDDIILGTNVINNWEITICKKEHSFDLFGNPVGSLTSLAFFRAKPCKNAVFLWKLFRNCSFRTTLFKFCEKPTDDLPNKANIYQNYFTKEGNYICVQNS